MTTVTQRQVLALLQRLADTARECRTCSGSGQDPRFKNPDACKTCGGVGETLQAECELGEIREIIARCEGR